MENEVRQKIEASAEQKSPHCHEEYEILLRPKLDFDVGFAICHRENRNVSGTKSSSSSFSTNTGLGSIASPLHVSAENRAVLSEDAATHTPTGSSSGAIRSPTSKGSAATTPFRIRKSHSSDDVAAYFTPNAIIVEKPVVEVLHGTLPDEYRHVQVGDVLEAIDGIATGATMLSMHTKSGNVFMTHRLCCPH